MLQVLNCGLKFIPTPTRRSDPVDIQQALDTFTRNVRLRFHFGEAGTNASSNNNFDPRYHVPNPDFEPELAPAAVEDFLTEVSTAVQQCYAAPQTYAAGRPSNLSTQQQSAVRLLTQDRSIVIKPSDKNLGPVILDTACYNLLLDTTLNDPTQYQVSAQPDVGALRRQLLALLARWQYVMGPVVHKYLLTAANDTVVLPQPYGMPKIHKLPEVTVQHLPQLTARVIGPCHSWITSGCSHYLAHLLNDACATKFKHVLPDSRTLVRQVEGKTVARHSILVYF